MSPHSLGEERTQCSRILFAKTESQVRKKCCKPHFFMIPASISNAEQLCFASSLCSRQEISLPVFSELGIIKGKLKQKVPPERQVLQSSEWESGQRIDEGHSSRSLKDLNPAAVP